MDKEYQKIWNSFKIRNYHALFLLPLTLQVGSTNIDEYNVRRVRTENYFARIERREQLQTGTVKIERTLLYGYCLERFSFK